MVCSPKGSVIMKRCLVWIVGFFFCSTAYAVEYSVDSIAEIREGEIAKFYPNSVRDKFGERYFEVMIRLVDVEAVAPQALFSRRITYRARCDDKELAPYVIDLRNVEGKSLKMIMVPPGAEEFKKPVMGSREDDWLWQVCG
jgi:hypothetical protein